MFLNNENYLFFVKVNMFRLHFFAAVKEKALEEGFLFVSYSIPMLASSGASQESTGIMHGNCGENKSAELLKVLIASQRSGVHIGFLSMPVS